MSESLAVQEAQGTQPNTMEAQARLIAIAALRPLNSPLAPIPVEHQGQAEILTHDLLGLINKDQRDLVRQRLGIGQNPKTFTKISSDLEIEYMTARQRYIASLKIIKNRVWDFRGKYPQPPSSTLKQQVFMFSPIIPETIAASLIGNVIGITRTELLPDVPFDFSRLSSKTISELNGYRSLGDYRRSTLALFGINKDPGISEPALEELKAEVEFQIW